MTQELPGDRRAEPESILVTGAAGFIGSHLSERLLGEGRRVIGFDNFCDFYDPAIKRARAERLGQREGFALIEGDIRDESAVEALFAAHRPDAVVHIAAMAGVRPSIQNPRLYTEVNIDGTATLLRAAERAECSRFVFASSSSVYGNNPKAPFSEEDPVDHPISPYAATKRAGELLCHAHWHLTGMPVACLRFFTVYGPGQRPDLAISKFLRLVADDRAIPMFGNGRTSRDYTFVDDIVGGVVAALDRIDRFRLYNLGGSAPVTLDELIQTIGRVTGRTVQLEHLPAQAGDVERTFADLSRSRAELGYEPRTTLEEGIWRQWEAMRRGG
ncbi:MAG: NAD-dependent epimerase/dehydratase family protein [Phycisphaerales bacterium]